MLRKRFSTVTVRRALLYVIAFTFTLSTLGQDALAFDKSYAAGNKIEFYEPCPTNGEGDTSADTSVGEYIAIKGIPADGLKVGASVFGGKQQGGKWVEDLPDNNGNDFGNANNHLTGTTSYAELGRYDNEKKKTISIGDALGGLPNGTKLEIALKTNGGVTNKIVAEKGDVGSGGPDVDGKKRGVDLWWETANLLGMTDGTAVVTIHAVPKNTPVTPLASKPPAEAPADDGNPDTDVDSSCCATGMVSGENGLLGSTNDEKIWNFLTGADGNIPAEDILTPEQAAGVMGNIAWESSYDPDKHEKAAGGTGYGLIQWSHGRRTALQKAAKKKGVPVSDLKFQLQYLYEESKSRAAINGGKEWEGLQKQESIGKSLVYWHDNSERSADTPEEVLTNRGSRAQKAYNKFYSKDTPKPTSGATAGQKPVVFIDPGHGGALSRYTDKKSGLVTNETPNEPEGSDVLEVAKKVKGQLEKAGYTVILARDKGYEPGKISDPAKNRVPTFRERADNAKKNKADIGISIHTTDGEINQAWPQRFSTKTKPIERHYGSNKDEFTNKETASTSEKYAQAIADARTKAEGHKVDVDEGNKQQYESFHRPGISSQGNIPLVALWADTVPWVYNEIAQDKGTAISDKRKEAYATGIVEGIKAAVTPGEGGCGTETTGGDLSAFILKYAWATYHGPPYFTMRPEYAAAVKKSQKDGRYVGGLGHPGIDCGGFVTTIMVDSGFEPKYNYSGKGGNTISQQAWMEKNWTKLGAGSSMHVGGKDDAKRLKQGDVAINANHTFMYAGDKGTVKGMVDGKMTTFDSNVASASVSFTGASWRTPMAGHDNLLGGEYTWYRKK